MPIETQDPFVALRIRSVGIGSILSIGLLNNARVLCCAVLCRGAKARVNSTSRLELQAAEEEIDGGVRRARCIPARKQPKSTAGEASIASHGTGAEMD